MRTAPTICIVLVLCLGASLYAMLGGSDDAPISAGGRPGDHEAAQPSVGPTLSTGGSARTALPDTKQKDAAEPTNPTLKQLRASAPTGNPSEWAALVLGTSRELSLRNSSVRGLLGLMAGGHRMDEPPYWLSFAFGASDRPWLKRLSVLFEREIKGRTHQDSFRRALQFHYRQILQGVAASRVRGHPILAARFSDGTLLRDMKDPSDKAWLGAAINYAQSGIMWGEIGVPKHYRELLSACDLPYISRRSQDLMRVASIYKDTEYVRREREVIWAELRDYLSSRE